VGAIAAVGSLGALYSPPELATAVPDGQIVFQFHAAGFNFHSAAHDWLVVAGPKPSTRH
jgi:hypothetical protein